MALRNAAVAGHSCPMQRVSTKEGPEHLESGKGTPPSNDAFQPPLAYDSLRIDESLASIAKSVDGIHTIMLFMFILSLLLLVIGLLLATKIM